VNRRPRGDGSLCACHHPEEHQDERRGLVPGSRAGRERGEREGEQAEKGWETLVAIVVRAVRVTTTAIALALAAYTVAEMLTLPRI